jgi:NAD(P)-dependent dehydrogenase (short-subunit alcohol dehydrogenase family)
VLINNAGVVEPAARIHESGVNDWWKSWEVSALQQCLIYTHVAHRVPQINLKGTYIPTREAIKRALAGSSKPNLVRSCLLFNPGTNDADRHGTDDCQHIVLGLSYDCSR